MPEMAQSVFGASLLDWLAPLLLAALVVLATTLMQRQKTGAAGEGAKLEL